MAHESVGVMRRDLHSLVRNPNEVNALQNLFRTAHFLAERISLVGLHALYKLTSAIEAVLCGLHKMPEEVNPSVLRTLSQSVDFFAVLLSEENLAKVKDPSDAVIFAVDDDAQGREMIAAAMKMADLKVKTADTPHSALALLEAEPFSLIFLDIGLPEMSGFDVCTRVRGFQQHRKTPIVFLTGLATFQNRVQGSLSGGNDFIAKPFNLHELGLKALLWVFKAQTGLA
jgi:CheY-like chemotaxis protein